MNAATLTPAAAGKSTLVDLGSPSADPFRTLRLGLQIRSGGRQGHIVLFTSAEPQEGKSTIASNFALVSSLSAGGVLLVDADVRRPSLHELFALPRAPGLVDLIAGVGGVRKMVRPVDGLGRLSLLTAGAALAGSLDIASSERLGEALAEAAETYSLIVIDSPPLSAAPDAVGLASHPGVSVVLVVRAPGRRRTIRKAMKKLELVDAHVAGIVLNRAGRLGGYYGY